MLLSLLEECNRIAALSTSECSPRIAYARRSQQKLSTVGSSSIVFCSSSVVLSISSYYITILSTTGWMPTVVIRNHCGMLSARVEYLLAVGILTSYTQLTTSTARTHYPHSYADVVQQY